MSQYQFDLPFYIGKFVRHLKRNNYSVETLHGYQVDLKMFNEFIFKEYSGEISTEQIQRDDLLNYLESLADRGYKPNSIQRNLSTLKSLYKFLFNELNFKVNVAERIKHSKVYVPLPTILDVEEVQHLLQTAKEYSFDYYVFFTLLYYTGSRITPIRLLKKENVHLDKKRIYLEKIKGGEDLYLPLHDKCHSVLKEYIKNHPYPNSIHLFPSSRRNDYPVHASNVRKTLKAIAKLAQIEKRVTPHLLRHCTATHLTHLGVDQQYIASILGHKDLRSTRRYQQLHVEHLRESVNKL
ncbi:tyrosine-type recombinase/integrase [Peribacillus sp. NPDC097206]|uniref:tyrosine-type recombinase/integrase n=1 Tax=Peribacillus sp. NPDC097206 TaxID=3364398 RepID=UPI003821473C